MISYTKYEIYKLRAFFLYLWVFSGIPAKEFKNHYALRKHAKWHDEPQINCPMCDETFLYQGLLFMLYKIILYNII